MVVDSKRSVIKYKDTLYIKGKLKIYKWTKIPRIIHSSTKVKEKRTYMHDSYSMRQTFMEMPVLGLYKGGGR